MTDNIDKIIKEVCAFKHELEVESVEVQGDLGFSANATYTIKFKRSQNGSINKSKLEETDVPEPTPNPSTGSSIKENEEEIDLTINWFNCKNIYCCEKTKIKNTQCDKCNLYDLNKKQKMMIRSNSNEI
jgi:hypothetical protein